MRLFAAALCAFLLAGAARAEDTQAPVIEHTPAPPTKRGEKVLQVFARVTDESKVFPQVFYRYAPTGEYQKPIDMKKVQGQKNTWGGNVPIKGDLVEYYVEAYDELGNGPGRAGDPDKPFRVDTSGEPPVVVSAQPPPVAAQPPPPPPRKIEPAPAPLPPPRRTTVASSSRGHTWTWIVGGVGLGALAGGLVAGQEVKNEDKAYTDRLASDPNSNYASLKAQYDANKSLGQKATILTVAGGVLLAGAVALYFFEPGFSGAVAAEETKSEVRFAAAPVDGGGAVAVAGRF
jgi:hypothetical protein